MELEYRLFQDYFGLLIPLLIGLVLIVYVKRSRPAIIKGVLLSHFSKVNFKNIQNNIHDREVTILLWTSVFLQGLYLNSYFIELNTPIYFYYLIVAIIIGLKHLSLKISAKTFNKEQLFEEYQTSFIAVVIKLGWFLIPASIINIIYLNKISINQRIDLNKTMLIFVLIFLVYRLFFLFKQANKEKISYLHIFLYLCTLEILPIVIISYYFLNN
tara:strand:- start:1420 stop:2061 length:642 start_codon:yes stop_codon:yes gene_type:complete